MRQESVPCCADAALYPDCKLPASGNPFKDVKAVSRSFGNCISPCVSVRINEQAERN